MDKASFSSIHPKSMAAQNIQRSNAKRVYNQPFSLHLKQALETNETLTISKHAKERIKERGIEITEKEWQQIEEKVKEAKKMGIKESLILLDDAALIVSTKNNTVITAMDRYEAKSQIFTNINGAILLG